MKDKPKKGSRAAVNKKTTSKKKTVKKRSKGKKELAAVDFDKLQRKAEKEQKKNEPAVPKARISKPPIKRVKAYSNGIEIYLKDSRKVSIAKEDDGSFVIETKKVLKEDEPFSAFSPAKIKYLTKGKIKVASCQLNISKEALIAIAMGINEMLKNGVFNDEEKK